MLSLLRFWAGYPLSGCCADPGGSFGGSGGLPVAGPLLLTLLSSYRESDVIYPFSLTKNSRTIDTIKNKTSAAAVSR